MTETVFYQDSYATRCNARVTATGDGTVTLDRTVFYPLGGGQPGDTGKLLFGDGLEIAVLDTRNDGGNIVHYVEGDTPSPRVDESVVAEIDWNRRYRHMRMHTCLHLLCSLVDAPVTGGSIAADKARLDFDLPESTLDKLALTASLNELVDANHSIGIEWISDEQLQQQTELVRTMSVKPPMGHGRVRLINIAGVDLQPCGGTHLNSTGEIGAVRVRKIEKKGKLNRRVILVFDE
jgi:misacylated tRNA(Ala) deacylase